MARFLQLHALASYPGTLLNRDDAGFAKRLPFGGATRTRVSSQCLKRHWRTHEGPESLTSLEEPMSVRSRYTFLRKLYEPLIQEGYPALLTLQVVTAIMTRTLSGKVKLSDNPDPKEALKSSQIVVLGMPELDYLKQLAKDFLSTHQEQLPLLWQMPLPDEKFKLSKDQAAEQAILIQYFDKNKELAKNLAALKLASGLDAALFGRMVTSDILARGDAAIHVAHAITVHAEASESDYFSAIDELLREDNDGELGSGHINSTELTSGLFYLYVVVDLPLLISNLEGVPTAQWQEADKSLATKVIQRLITMMATVSPGAKKGSTAPYAHAQMVMAELGDAQPRTLANAFLSPVKERPDLAQNTYDALTSYYADWSRMYGRTSTCHLAAMGDAHALADVIQAPNTSLQELITACSLAITGQAP